jgi:hypothetical protein
MELLVRIQKEYARARVNWASGDERASRETAVIRETSFFALLFRCIFVNAYFFV